LAGPDKTKADKTRLEKTKPLAGGVRHDARGNAVWQWATETARHAVASTSQMLRRLEVSNLKLEELDESKLPPGEAGFNPYDGASVKPQPAAKKPTAVQKKAPAAPVRVRTSWWRALFRRR
jgi:hypothetical protein